MLRLYTFNVSHFSEKARWALDYEGISYEERVLLPGPHQFLTRRIAPRTHVPVGSTRRSAAACSRSCIRHW